MLVNQIQSVELVQSIIAATISNVTWVRKMFPKICYEPRWYDFTNRDVSYENFMSGEGYGNSEPHDPGTVGWRVLVPGQHIGVDKVLKWLVRDLKFCR
jgi:hypothetical protein